MKPKLLLLILLLLYCASGSQAEDQTRVFRIIGLSAPERQNDLREILKAVPDVQLQELNFDKSEGTFRYDTERLFPDSKGKNVPPDDKILARVNELLSNASQQTLSLTMPSTVPADKLTKLEIKVGILDCKACRYAAYSVIAKMAGVERAVVNKPNSTLEASIDATKTNLDALLAALKKANVPLPEK